MICMGAVRFGVLKILTKGMSSGTRNGMTNLCRTRTKARTHVPSLRVLGWSHLHDSRIIEKTNNQKVRFGFEVDKQRTVGNASRFSDSRCGRAQSLGNEDVRCRLQDCTPLLKCLVEVHCRQDLDSAPTVLQRVKGRQGPPHPGQAFPEAVCLGRGK